MQNVLIYGGIAINVLGALIVLVYAIKYYLVYRQVKRMPQRVEELRSKWYVQRKWGWGNLLSGTIISLIGCFV